MHMSKIYCKYRSNKSRICRLWNMKAGALYWICLIWGQGVMDRVLILRKYREKDKCPLNMKWALNLSDWEKDWQGWNGNIGIGWLWKMLKGICCPLSVKVKSNLSDREMTIEFFWWSKDREGYWKEGLYIEYFWLGRGGECWYWNWLIEERVAVSHQPPFQQQVFSNVLTEVLQWIYSTQYLKLQVSLMDWRK